MVAWPHLFHVHAHFLRQMKGQQHELAGMGNIEVQGSPARPWDDKRLAKRAFIQLHAVRRNVQLRARQEAKQSAAQEKTLLVCGHFEALAAGALIRGKQRSQIRWVGRHIGKPGRPDHREIRRALTQPTGAWRGGLPGPALRDYVHSRKTIALKKREAGKWKGVDLIFHLLD
jgi:hypothetical protein